MLGPVRNFNGGLRRAPVRQVRGADALSEAERRQRKKKEESADPDRAGERQDLGGASRNTAGGWTLAR